MVGAGLKRVAMVLVLGAGPAAGQSGPALAEEEAAKAWERTLDLVRKGTESSLEFPLNTVPEGCLANPLPLVPTGPSVTLLIEGFQESAEMTIWRAPCRPDNAALLITFRPLVEQMFVCSTRLQISQNGVQYDSARLVDDVETADRLCADLMVTTTTVVDQPPFAEAFDPNLGFEVLYRGTVDHEAVVGPYVPEDYFSPEEFTDRVLRPPFGGAWFEPDAPGQGFQFLFAEVEGDQQLVAYWYTYEGGQQRFFFGVAPVTAGQREIEIPLSETSGADFGSAFDPDDVIVADWGRLWLTFQTCNRGRVRYERTSDGAQGTLEIERLTSLASLPCRELAEVR